MIELTGRVYGAEQTQRLLAAAPNAYRKGIRRFFYSERKKYVGNKRIDGKFRRQLSRRRHQGAKFPFNRPDSNQWSRQVYKSFKGYVFNVTRLDGMTLRMGIGLRKPSAFVRGLERMDRDWQGSRVLGSAGKGEMSIPAWGNINKVWQGLRGNAWSDLKPHLTPFKTKHGTTLWFDKRQKKWAKGKNAGRFKKSALMFVGKKAIEIDQQFDFVKQWDGQLPKVVKRGQRQVDLVTRRLLRGYSNASDFRSLP